MAVFMGRIAIMLVAAAVAMPLSASAQEAPKKKEEPARAAPAKPAARAPAPRPQPPAARAPARPEPQRAATPPQRQAPAASTAVPQQQQRAQERRQERILQRQQVQPKAVTPQQQQAQPKATIPQAQQPSSAAQTPPRQLRRERRQDLQPQQAQPKAVTPQEQKTATPQVAKPAAVAQTPQQLRQEQRKAQREERTLRQRENRALRALPAKQRAARREEIQRARTQRAQQLQQAQPNARTTLQAQPNAAITQNARVRSGLRRNGQARVTVQAARQGRFASAFAARTQGAKTAHVRGSRFAARQAWRHGHRAGFVPWYGPVFWPYAYSDVFDYAFWPGGYDDGYFAYAYDDFFDGVYFGEAGPPQEYVPEYAYAEPSAPARPTYAGVQELCKQPGTGITAWPFAEIEKKVGLNAEQKQLLGDVKNAGAKAAGAFKASCPSENAFPLTPPGRLSAMTARLDATLGAVQTVKPALEKFYASLSDEQKERFNEIGPKLQPADKATTAKVSADESKSCKEQKPGLTNLPIERIEDAVKPTDAQAGDLKSLEDATAKAVSIMQAACPEDTPITPPGRLEAMEKRLQAMIEAANTVKPALGNFYGSLNAEQKARFNRIGRDLAQSGG